MLTSDFRVFVRDVHGHDPFPWQQGLARRIAAERRWPDRIDIPTGLGKTSVLDVAVFLAAALPELARRRIFLVADRQADTDDAHRHARRLQDALTHATPDTAAHAVAEALRRGAGSEGPVLEVTRLCGGVTWDARWLQRPDRYAIITGALDQVGSRLLFRGHGVSEYARSIDAALVGTDSLIIIDDAHGTEPFLDTVRTLTALERHSPVATTPVVVDMSATGGRAALPCDADGGWTHRHTAADEDHAVAGHRLRAGKHLHLVKVRASRHADRGYPDALAALTRSLTPHGVVGVVVNTVARARAVFERLSPDTDVILWTGRSRPVDREYLHAAYWPRMAMDRHRATGRPLVVVATQSIEAANIDLDALVTESAPLAPLTRRLGRLNRAGHHGTATALIVQESTARAPDPVYGAARIATWRWLAELVPPVRYSPRLDPATLDEGLPASPAALWALARQAPDDVTAPPLAPPVLHESTLDAWACTSPPPDPDPPTAPYLHGLAKHRATVSLVWRTGLAGRPPGGWRHVVDAAPPTAEETLELPVDTVRLWLRTATADSQLSDLGTERDTVSEQVAPYKPRVGDKHRNPRVLVYRGQGDALVATPAQIRPGDLLVVPAEYGGCDHYGWHPTSPKPVLDVADLAWRRGGPILRISPYLTTVARARHGDQIADSLDELLALATRGGDPAPDLPPLLRNLHRLAEDTAALRVTNTYVGGHGGGQGPVVLVLSTGLSLTEDHSTIGSSIGSSMITLAEHQQAVELSARLFATNLDLPPDLIDAVGLAARWHDEGKRDPHFQARLWGGDQFSAELATEPLAKTDRNVHRVGYPNGKRHEALSAQIAALHLATTPDMHPDLVTHLIATHHGRSRPIPLPSVTGLGLGDLTEGMDWDSPRRFRALNRRYGRYGLALLETIVRLADTWCSAGNGKQC